MPRTPSSSCAMPRLQTAPDLRYRGHAPAESERAPARAHTGDLHGSESPLSATTPLRAQWRLRDATPRETGQVRISLRRNADSAGRSRAMTPNTQADSPKREKSPRARTLFRQPIVHTVPLSDAAEGQRTERNGPKQTPKGKRQYVLGRERRVALALWKGECRHFFALLNIP